MPERGPGATTALAGLRVLVTRPAGGGAELAARIERHSGAAVLFPVIDIEPADAGELRAELRDLARADLAIFVSVYAARAVVDAMARLDLRFPESTRVAAIGPKTAAVLWRARVVADFTPRARIDSEGLLQVLRRIEVAGKRVVIFRGQDGREELARGLRVRGAVVRHVEAYRRRVTAAPVAPLIERWQGGGIDAVVISSAAVFDALAQLLDAQRDLLEAAPIFAYSARIAAHCRARGARGRIIAAERPSDGAVVEALKAWRAA